MRQARERRAARAQAEAFAEQRGTITAMEEAKESLSGLETATDVPQEQESNGQAGSESSRSFNMPDESSWDPAASDPERRVYLMGVGAVGTFLATSLKNVANPPPTTLLMHNRGYIRSFDDKRRALEYTVHNRTERVTGFDVESQYEIQQRRLYQARGNDPIIHNLIVSTKSIHARDGIQMVAHRLGPESTICFMMNGMGLIEELNEHVFPDPATRPKYLIGIISHGLYLRERFHVEHRGIGTIALSAEVDLTKNAEANSPRHWPASTRYLMRTLTRSSTLGALGVQPADLKILQLEKFVANCIINPLTAIYNCRNGDLGMNSEMRRVMRLMIAEISLVVRSLPELAPLGQHRIEERFNPKRMEFMAYSIMRTTAPNLSSMWQDVFNDRADGHPTEINYLNGYVVRRGEEAGIKCICNYMIMQQVEAQRALQQRKRRGLGPFEKWSELDDTTKATLRAAQAAQAEAEEPL